MIKVVDTQEYLDKILETWRPKMDSVLAFYEHRLGVIGKDPRLMLIPLDERMAIRGDGVFEALKWIDGKMYQLDPHLKRMERSCKAIYLNPPCPWDEVYDICMEVARAAGTENGYLRIYVGRGPGGFGINPGDCPVPSLYVAAHAYKAPDEVRYEKGITAFRCSVPAKADWFAQIKCTDYLPNVLMLREALEKGYDNPICFGEDGFVSEGATENCVIVTQDDELLIPEFTNTLRGTTLMRAIELLDPKVRVSYRKVPEDEIYNAKELILMGTTKDAVPVVRYNDKPIHDARPGPFAKLLRELLVKDIAENGVQL